MTDAYNERMRANELLSDSTERTYAVVATARRVNPLMVKRSMAIEGKTKLMERTIFGVSRYNMRVLDSGHPGGLPAALGMERRRDGRPQVHLHERHGLRLPRVPVLRHDHLPRPADRGFLRPHIPRNRKTGQSQYERERLRESDGKWGKK